MQVSKRLAKIITFLSISLCSAESFAATTIFDITRITDNSSSNQCIIQCIGYVYYPIVGNKKIKSIVATITHSIIGNVKFPIVDPSGVEYFYFFNDNRFLLSGGDGEPINIQYQIPLILLELNAKNGHTFNIDVSQTFSQSLNYEESFFNELFPTNTLTLYQNNYVGITVSSPREINLIQTVSTKVEVFYGVPEPQSWSLFIIGFTLIGYRLRSRLKVHE
jgi:hypothetical protein